MIVDIKPWGRGFMSFGDRVRETSIATHPTAWVRFVDDETELAMGDVPDAIKEHKGESELVFQLKAWVAWAETLPNPRWLSWERPGIRPGPVEYLGEPKVGSAVVHRYGTVLIAQVELEWRRWFTDDLHGDLPAWLDRYGMESVELLVAESNGVQEAVDA